MACKGGALPKEDSECRARAIDLDHLLAVGLLTARPEQNGNTHTARLKVTMLKAFEWAETECDHVRQPVVNKTEISPPLGDKAACINE